MAENNVQPNTVISLRGDETNFITVIEGPHTLEKLLSLKETPDFQRKYPNLVEEYGDINAEVAYNSNTSSMGSYYIIKHEMFYRLMHTEIMKNKQHKRKLLLAK